MKLKVQRIHHRARLPEYASDGAACLDIRCVGYGDVPPLGTAVFSTGLRVEVPEGYALLLFSRSGHGFKNDIRLANCVGVIDSDYRGEVKVKLSNDSRTTYSFEPCDRIAQAMLVQIPKVDVEEVEELTETERGAGGFGSTGNN
jgi:dUTP pyrophosphatase